MGYPGYSNYSRPRGEGQIIRIAVDPNITPPASSDPTGVKAGQIWAGEGLYLSPASLAASLSNSDPQVNTTATTTVAAGTRTVTVAALGNIVVGMTLLIDTVASGVQESVVVTAINAGTPSFTAVFANGHTANYPVVNAKANYNSQFFIGVAESNSYIEVIPKVGGGRGAEEQSGDGISWWVEMREAGDFTFQTTASDTYNAYDKVYLGADGQTVQKTALGTYIGRVSPDQQAAAGASSPAGVGPGTAITGAAGQRVIVRITPALL